MTEQVPAPPPVASGGKTGRVVAAGVTAALALVVLVVAVLLPGSGTPNSEAPPPAAAPSPGEPGEPGLPTASTGTPAAPDRTGEPDTGEEPRPGARADLQGPRPDGIDRIAEEVAAVRGLAVAGELDARVVPAAELGAKFTELAFEEQDTGQLDLDGRLLTALRLLEPGEDLRATIEALYTAQILGLYVVEDQVLYIGGQSPQLTAAQRVTAAHEVLHALQDQAFDLEAFMDLDDEESDSLLARLALVEGDAILTQELWSLRFQSEAEREEARQESRAQSPSALAAAPDYVRESLLFPYREGFVFVQALFSEGGYAAVDAAFADPPTSTRHIMRPETYVAGEEHTGTTVTTQPGPGWQDASRYTFGEFDLDQWLVPLGGDRRAVTAGWDGGETRHWHDGDQDAVAVSLRLADTGAAGAACAGVRQWYATVAGGQERSTDRYQGDRDWMAVSCEGLDVVVGIAPDGVTAERLVGR